MAARPISTATISFGLVSIPVKLFTSTKSSESISFRMLHATCNSPLKQQYICPQDNEVVERDDIVKGYEYAKDQYVILTKDEIKALEEESTKAIAVEEFVPLDTIDGVYLDKTYYLAPEKGGERAYQLFSKALSAKGLGGLARYAARGKQYLVVVRPVEGGLVMQQLRYASEVRSFSEVPVETKGEIKDTELKLALQLIEQTTAGAFEPEKYVDDPYLRTKEYIQQKIDGQEIAVAPGETPRAQVIDLMEALKASLAGGGSGATAAGEENETAAEAGARKPAKPSPRKKAAKKTAAG